VVVTFENEWRRTAAARQSGYALDNRRRRCPEPGTVAGVGGSSWGCAIALGLVIGDLCWHRGQPDWRLVAAASVGTGG
jgi:hypothetical protein